jgi:hypothetical protein
MKKEKAHLVIGGANMLICVIRNGYNFINNGHV